MHKIEKGEYECPQCKRLTVIGRTKKSEFPLTCCQVEMTPKKKMTFSEPPPPKDPKAAKSKASRTRTAKATSSRSGTGRKKTATAVVAAESLPLSPGHYLCPTCGKSKVLGASDPRDVWLRCPDCFVKMQIQA